MKTKILIVDDKAANLKALESLLQADDVDLVCASSGEAALAQLLDHEFALALLDVQMPGMSGFELAKLMRGAERSKAVPIIFVTASQTALTDIFEGYDRGAVDYLLKPLSPHVVRSKVRVFVELDQKSRRLAAQSAELAARLRELEALRSAADAANQAKSRFIANMSHEIRTPLASVLGYADVLRLPQQSEDDRQACVNSIARNGQLLLRLVDDVLDLAKIEAERVETERLETSLPDLLLDVRTVHQYRAAEKGLTLDLVAAGELPRTIQTDAFRLKQILNNLLGNALKFTDTGKVTLRVELESGSRLVRFSVKDTGCGLTTTEAGRLFQPFMQADASTKRRYGGTGLGLAISKQLARLLGGDVVLVDSRPGDGSTFALTIDPGPLAPGALTDGQALLRTTADANLPSAAVKVRIDGLRVLVADDAKDNRHLVSRLLKAAGAQVDLAVDGAEAIEKALQAPYDVVLMDIQMPGTDGYEATATLRASGYDRPIFALTAHAMKEELDRCLAVGCDQYLSKPINYRDLLARLSVLCTTAGLH